MSPAANPDREIPFPGDLEEHDSFVARFVGHATMKTLPLFRRNKRAEQAWQEAKQRSRVSVNVSGGQWLLFD